MTFSTETANHNAVTCGSRTADQGLYCQNAVVLSAGVALAWVAALLRTDIDVLMAEVEAAQLTPAETPVFTPYLAGERTPHHDPALASAFSGLAHNTGLAALAQSVLEGVALALADCHETLLDNGAAIAAVTLTSGGARSRQWGRLTAAALGCPLEVQVDAQSGSAIRRRRCRRAQREARIDRFRGLGSVVSETHNCAMKRLCWPSALIACFVAMTSGAHWRALHRRLSATGIAETAVRLAILDHMV